MVNVGYNIIYTPIRWHRRDFWTSPRFFDWWAFLAIVTRPKKIKIVKNDQQKADY